MNDTEALIHRYYEAFNAKDWDGMLACLAEDVRHDVNEGAVRGGRDKFRAFLAHMDTCYDETLTDMAVMVSRNERRAAAEFIVNGTYKTTDGDLPPARGQTYRLPAGAFFEVEDGFIRRVTTYYNLNEWIRQVS
ncbi:ketosteroid isomerase-related protein [uncultured Hyphomonas sp.]|uniref:ketosteroid isomerase-related protein n=1 Tax=uncultured Hyphomonas sp. TaxID=225298 RepID=UPI002AAC2E7F|nr:ketosteroid isomerase-related protein [uncultured Hyphomonas sp.]